MRFKYTHFCMLINQELLIITLYVVLFFSVSIIFFILRIKLLTSTSLAIYNADRSDKGMYQCLVTNKESSAQAMAELKLGGESFDFEFYFSKISLEYESKVMGAKKK